MGNKYMKKSVAVVIAAAVAAVVFYGVRYVRMPVETLTAKAETKESRIEANGVIVYNESVYTASDTGTFYSYTGEGERVGKNRRVATVYNGIVDKEVLQSLNNIDKKIADAEEEIRKSGIYVSDKSSKQAVIENVKNEIIDAVIEEDVSKIAEYKNKLKAAVGSEDANDAAQTLAGLKSEKSRVEALITQSHRDIYSDISGIYTTALDGLEGKIKPADLSWYMAADFRALAEPQENVMGNRTVKKGDAVCKVVDNHEWYVIAVVPKEEAAQLKAGDAVKLRVAELPGESVDAKIDYISPEPEGAGEYLVSVRCERYLEGVFNIRKSDIEIIMNSYYGFEIPVYAIHVQDGKNGVMVQNGRSQGFRECKILYRNDETGMVIVEPSGDGKQLEQGDKIVLGEK